MSTQINALLENDDVRRASRANAVAEALQRIVTLLRLAGQLIEAIHPDQTSSEADEDADANRRAIIEQRAEEFYKTLDVRG